MSQGVYRVKEGEGCFGLLTVSDRGDQLQVSFSGRNNQDEEKISLQFAVPAAHDASGKSRRPASNPARKRSR